MVATVIGGTLAAGGANAINMYVDRDVDALMERTKNRPLVTGLITPRAALTFAIGLEIVANTPEQMAKFQAEELARWKQVIVVGKIELE